jgi:chromosome segregation ATPase
MSKETRDEKLKRKLGEAETKFADIAARLELLESQVSDMARQKKRLSKRIAMLKKEMGKQNVPAVE